MTYKGLQVLDIAPDFTSLRSGLVDDSTFDGPEAGAATPWKATTVPRRTISYPFSLTSREQIAEFRRFIAAHRGRLGAFWLPVYMRDFEIVSISGTEVIVRHVGLADALTDFGQFQHIIFYAQGELQIAQIDEVTSDGNEETITLTEAIDTEPDPDETLCGGAMVVRCFNDEHEYQFNGLEFAKVDVRFIEIPTEYPDGDGGGGGWDEDDLDDPVLDDGDGGTAPPGVGGTVSIFESQYVWGLGSGDDPNTVIDATTLGIYKALFLNERQLFIAETPGIAGWGGWYWKYVSSSGTFKSAFHKTGFPSTDPESPDGEWTASFSGYWLLAQNYRIP